MDDPERQTDAAIRAELEAEIKARLGRVPSFFRLGVSAELSRALWRQAQVAYLESPLPAGFQEPLFAYLSRFCEIPYCMVHHAGLLLGRGGPVSGTGANPEPYQVEQVLQLLRRPVSRTAELESHWKTLARYDAPIDAWPDEFESPLGAALFECAVHVFLREGSHTRCVVELRRVLGPEKLERLTALLSFVRSAHAWTEAHAGPQLDRDFETMLSEEPKLRLWVEEYRAVVERELGSAALQDMSAARGALRDSAEHLGSILEDSLNEIYVFDAETLRFTRVNRGARENLGYSMAEMRKLRAIDLNPEFSEAAFEAMLEPLRSRSAPRLDFTTQHRRKDGSLYPVEVHLQLTAKGDSFVAIILDLTAALQREAELDRVGAQARGILNTAADAIISIDISGTIVGANAATTKLFGYEENELVGHNVRMLMPSHHSEAHDGYLRRYAGTGEAKIIGKGRELEARRKDGSLFPIRLSVGEALADEARLFTGIIHDLSDTRELQAQLLHAQKMEAIGTLAGGIAHDFNNLLTSIRGSSEILVDRLEPGSRLAQSALRIQKAADRAASLTNRLLGFSRKQAMERRALDLNRAVAEARELAAHLLAEDVEFTTDLCREAPYVFADESQISQVLMNLIVNAAAAIAPGGSLVLTTARDVVAGERAAAFGVSDGDYVVLRVTDTGAGIPPETLGRIFDPFFTTKDAGKGTGLGLSTVFGIVQEHGGTISVQSEVGVGTTFTIFLPLIGRPAVAGADQSTVKVQLPAASETVLLVEDDDMLRDLIAEVLEEEGYGVIRAAKPTEALRRAREHTGEIALLITDVVMPEMSGFSLGKELRSQRPSIQVLYMSGYMDHMLAERGELHEDAPFIRKPFANDAMLEKVREVLDAGGESA